MKTKKNKITIIGGGSFNWCPNLLSDILRAPELDNSEIVLLDPNESAREEICKMAKVIIG